MSKFQPGQSGNPNGRKPGCRNRFNEAFITDAFNDWQLHGAEVFERVRAENPLGYLRVMASIVPRQFHIQSENNYQTLSEEELKQLARWSNQPAAARDSAGSTARAVAPPSSDKLN
jgi:hypothetical protein